MPGGLLSLCAPLLGFALNVCVQILCARRPGASLLKSIFLGFAAGTCATAALDVLQAAAGPDPGLPLWQVLPFNFVLHGMIGYCYFHVVNLTVTARRIRILRGISLAASPPTLEDILREYGARQMVDKRLARLLKSGQIVEREGRYHVLPGAVLAMTVALGILKRCVYGKRSGGPNSA
jgi:hypothetical protein